MFKLLLVEFSTLVIKYTLKLYTIIYKNSYYKLKSSFSYKVMLIASFHYRFFY